MNTLGKSSFLSFDFTFSSSLFPIPLSDSVKGAQRVKAYQQPETTSQHDPNLLQRNRRTTNEHLHPRNIINGMGSLRRMPQGRKGIKR